MAEIARIARTKAKKAPAETFASPDDIVGNIMMTRGEKLGVLRLWRRQLQEDIGAWVDQRSEGDLQHAQHLLVEIERAIDELSTTDAAASSVRSSG